MKLSTCSFVIAALSMAHPAGATSITFLNSTPITINQSGFPTAYPSTVSTPAGTWSLYVVDDTVGDAGSITSWGVQLDVVGGGVADVNVLLNGLSHTLFQDIDMYVLGPNGVAVELATDRYGSIAGTVGRAGGGNYAFDDAAASAIPTSAISGVPILAPGSYKAEGSVPPNPTSLANIVNFYQFPTNTTFAANLGAYNGIAYHDPAGTAPVPEPGTLLLVGGGVAAIARRMRRRPQVLSPTVATPRTTARW